MLKTCLQGDVCDSRKGIEGETVGRSAQPGQLNVPSGRDDLEQISNFSQDSQNGVRHSSDPQ